MKIKKRFLMIGLMGVCLFGLFAGVACKPTGGDSSGNATPKEILVCGFENYKELTSLRWVNSFGAVELSQDYKTQGENAAKLTVRGHHQNSSKPQMIMPTDTNYVPKTDYTDVESILVDVYNANDTEQKIGFQYLTKAEETQILSAEIICTIPAKTQKTLEYKVDRNITAQFLNLDLVSSLRLTFENQKSYHDANRIFYVDNMRIKTTEEPIDTSVKARQDGEYESCDRPEYLASWGNILKKVYSDSILSFNADTSYVKGGDGSFKLVSNYSGGSATETRSVGFKLLKTENKNISEYYSISFWIYNANDVPTNFFLNDKFVQTLSANEWAHIELTMDWLIAQGLDVENFYPAFVFHAYHDKPYTWYVDEICLNKVAVNLVAPTLNATDNQDDKELSLKWENDGAASYSYKVLVDGVEQVAETNLGVQTSITIPYASYMETGSKMLEVLVTAYGNGDAKQTSVYKKAFFGFTSVPENFLMQIGETKTLPLAQADEGEITWVVEDIRAITTGHEQFKVFSTLNNPTEITFAGDKDRLLKVTWTLQVGEYIVEDYTFILPDIETYAPLTSKYEDLLTTAEGKYTGDIKASDYELLEGQKTIRVYNGTGFAQGSFVNNVFLGEHMSHFDYFLYNASDAAVKVTITSNDNTFTIPAHSMVKMNFAYWANAGAEWTAWKIVNENGTLNDMYITATSTGESPVDVYIGYFRVNANAFDYGPIYLSGETAGNKATVTWPTLKNTKNYSYQVYINGNEVMGMTNLDKSTTLTFDYSQYLADIVELEIIVTATSNDDDTVTATWKKSFLEFISVPANVFVTITEDYTLQLPTYTKGELTWVVEVYDNRMMYGSDGAIGSAVTATYENPTTLRFTHEHYGAKATWTLTLGTYMVQAYTIYSPIEIYTTHGDSIAPIEPSTTYFSSGTANGDLAETDTSIISGTQGWLRLHNGTGKASGSYTVGENVIVGSEWTAFSYYIYNNSDAEVTISTANGNVVKTIQAHTAMHMNFSVYSIYLGTAWALVDPTTGYLKDFAISASSETGVVDVYLGALRVDRTALELGELALTGDAVNQVATVNWNPVKNAARYSYRVIVDGAEKVALTNIGLTCQAVFDYAELTVQEYVEVEVTAYDASGNSKTARWRYLSHSGTY